MGGRGRPENVPGITDSEVLIFFPTTVMQSSQRSFVSLLKVLMTFSLPAVEELSFVTGTCLRTTDSSVLLVDVPLHRDQTVLMRKC